MGQTLSLVLSQITENRKVEARKSLILQHTIFTFGLKKATLRQNPPTDFADSLKRAFDTYWEEGAERPRMMSIGLHPRLIGQAARIAGLKDFLDYALAKGAVWFAKRIDI